jgi:glycosyltransferase involved in cell wall biosynthesis
MNVALLPSFGSGLTELAAMGQTSRLIDGYLRPYLAAFHELHYFTYYPESLADFTTDADLLARVHVLAPRRRRHRLHRAIAIPFVHAGPYRTCAVARVFHTTGGIPAMIGLARFGVPYVTTYGFRYSQLSRRNSPWRRRLKARLERATLRRAAAVIATTEDLRAEAQALAPRVHVALIPNGVDTGAFAPPPTRAPRAPGQPYRVLYVGRLSREKNLLTLIDAAARLAPHRPLRVVAAGSGPLEPLLRERAAKAGVDLELLGVVAQPALPSVYASADAFVLASENEGHPKALLEAMSAGLPCVASDCEGNRSIVTDGETGLLFDYRRPEELADRLDDVLGNPARARELGAAARRIVIERYELGTWVAREIELVRRVGAGRLAS